MMKILVVDDSQFAQKLIGKFLKERIQDAELNFASTGEEGYKIYQSFTPDLIITDLLMPGIDGKMFIKLVRHVDQNVKIVVLSADVQNSVKQEMEEYGITLFLNKPLDEKKQQLLLSVLEEI